MARIGTILHNDTIGKTLMLFTQTNRLYSKYLDAFFYKKSHISFVKFLVLKLLAGRNGLMTPTQIANWTHTELHNITQLVARMKREELIYTEHSDKDGRTVNVFLTEKGQNILNHAMPVANEFINKIMQSISKDDATKLIQIIGVIRDNAYEGLESLKSED
jgi:DNA-binding MarR family transcriptional regulator